MKVEARRNLIVDLLVEEKAVDLNALADRFYVSKMTIHRDLEVLERAGVLRKIRGGATITPSKKFESNFRVRELQNKSIKTEIAKASLSKIEPGMTVMINDGTTAAVLGAMLKEKRPLTVITNNGSVIDDLKHEPGITLISLGGYFSSKYNGFFGLVAEQTLDQLRGDIAFISSPAVSGLQTFHMDEDVSRVKRAMMRSAEHTCLLINHERFGHSALYNFADLRDFNSIITGARPSSETMAVLQDAGITLQIAKEML